MVVRTKPVMNVWSLVGVGVLLLTRFHGHGHVAVAFQSSGLQAVDTRRSSSSSRSSNGCPRRRPSTYLYERRSSRREWLSFSVTSAAVSGVMAAVPPKPAVALGEGEERMVLRQQPKAPTGALLPAIQQRLLLELCVDLVKEGSGSSGEGKLILRLQSILPPLSASEDGTKPLSNPFQSTFNYNYNYNYHYNNNADLRLMKEYSPATTLRGDLSRAAMNVYTANLNYGEAIVAPAPFEVTDSDWKKSYIRANDGLPSVKQVIAADLDIRDLYRNQVQLKVEDAAAELYSSARDMDELRGLLREAAQTFDLWLGRIPDANVQTALQAAMAGESLQVYEPYIAGFLPTPTR